MSVAHDAAIVAQATCALLVWTNSSLPLSDHIKDPPPRLPSYWLLVVLLVVLPPLLLLLLLSPPPLLLLPLLLPLLLLLQVMDEIVFATAKAMVSEGIPFRGVLFAGLMIKNGKVGN